MADNESTKIVKNTEPMDVLVDNVDPINVNVRDINMSFTSMVVFMVKWVIASIPALIILFLLGFWIMAIFGAGILAIFK